jgi:hypothetical protein
MAKQIPTTGEHGVSTITPLIHHDLNRISYVGHSTTEEGSAYNHKDHPLTNHTKMVAHLEKHGELKHFADHYDGQYDKHYVMSGHHYVQDTRNFGEGTDHIIHGTHEGLSHLAKSSGAKSSVKAIQQHGPNADMYHEDMHNESAKKLSHHLKESLNMNVNENASPDATISTLNNDGTIDTKEVSVGEIGEPFDPHAAVTAALNGEPLEFEKQIKLGLADRIQNAVERKREDVAQAIFGNPNEEEPTSSDDAEVGDEEDEENVSPEAPEEVQDEDEDKPNEE